jgi:mannan endo-1,4-beta-mannosidase
MKKKYFQLTNEILLTNITYLSNLVLSIKLKNKLVLFVLCMLINLKVSALDPATPNANNDVKLILNYYASLTSMSDHRLISGQFIGYNEGLNNYSLINTIYNKTNKWVGIVCSDYIDWSTGQEIKYDSTNANLIKAWKAGSLVTVQVHMNNPANPNVLNFQDKNVDLNQLLVPGTTTYINWITEMDKIAAGLSELQDSGVVVLFRPFHEMNGDWFWWGGKTPSLFIQVWRQMFDYFTNTKKLNNIIWVFGPAAGLNASDYYPGDAYVDITGLDAYTSTITSSEISGYSSMLSLGKPFGFTEFGPVSAENPPTANFDYRIFINGLKTNFPAACFFVCWDQNWGLSTNKFVTEALSDNYVANRNDLAWKQPENVFTKANSELNDVTVYPNPLENGSTLKIKMQGLIIGDEIKVSVFDLTGKIVDLQALLVNNTDFFEINLSNKLQQGVYIINIESPDKDGYIKLLLR